MEKELGYYCTQPLPKETMNVFSDIRPLLQDAITNWVANCVNGAMYTMHFCHAYQIKALLLISLHYRIYR